jgi:hypothetical protein
VLNPKKQGEHAGENDDTAKDTKRGRQARFSGGQQQHNSNAHAEGGYDVKSNRDQQRPPNFDDERGSDDANETDARKEKTDGDGE